MKNINKKGFTLVELLAVIVILALIMGIAVFSIGGIINKASADSKSESVTMILKDTKTAMVENNISLPATFDISSDGVISPSTNSSIKVEYAKVPDIKIPDVVGKTVIEAENELKKLGFEVAIDIEYVGSDDIEKGLIVKTSPTIGRTVKKGTEITLYESTGKIVYTVEDYTGRNSIEVKTILETTYELNVLVEEIEPDDDKEHDAYEILKQDLAVGTEVAKGTTITLYIPTPTPKYPNFTDNN